MQVGPHYVAGLYLGPEGHVSCDGLSVHSDGGQFIHNL